MLFNAFTKIMTNRNLNKEGCGLGLTISKNIAQALGGDITLQSEVGIGSKFILTLPYKESQSILQQTSEHVDSEPLNSQPTDQSYNVLINDDIPQEER